MFLFLTSSVFYSCLPNSTGQPWFAEHQPETVKPLLEHWIVSSEITCRFEWETPWCLELFFSVQLVACFENTSHDHQSLCLIGMIRYWFRQKWCVSKTTFVPHILNFQYVFQYTVWFIAGKSSPWWRRWRKSKGKCPRCRLRLFRMCHGARMRYEIAVVLSLSLSLSLLSPLSNGTPANWLALFSFFCCIVGFRLVRLSPKYSRSANNGSRQLLRWWRMLRRYILSDAHWSRLAWVFVRPASWV